MSVLEPYYAAQLASDVYVVKSELTRGDFKAVYEDDMDLSGWEAANSPHAVAGTTGALVFLKSSHVMGVTAVGKGKFKNEAFVVLKGTASLLDALTDANVGLRYFPEGGYVHQGFYYTFLSFRQQLKRFLASLSGKQVHTIHCIGHSLGGALATLSAQWIKSQVSATVKLYTFGSPRVGLPYFAGRATHLLGETNIYRVFHRTDPVPMVPTWPFTHVPDSNNDYLIDSTTTLVPWHFHLMARYLESTKGKSWIELRNHRPKEPLARSVEAWLKSDSVLTWGENTLEMLNAAFWYVIQKVVKASGIVLIGGFATQFTLLDRLAYLMSRAFEITADATKKLSIWVVCLVRKLARLIGIVVNETTNLTYQLIRWIFLRVQDKVNAMVRQAGKLLS